MTRSPDIPDRDDGGGLTRYHGRYRWLTLIVLTVFLGLLARFWYLQILRGDTYYRTSSENIVQEVKLEPPRGRIYDRDGVPLATNRTSYNVVLRPHILERHEPRRVLERLQHHLNLPNDRVETLLQKIEEDSTEIVVQRDLGRNQLAALETDRLRLPGIDIRTQARRYYPLDDRFAHTVGFMGAPDPSRLDQLRKRGYQPGDYIGQMGLERAFEPLLRGSPGIERRVVNAQGIPQNEAESRKWLGTDRRLEAIPGRDLITTLDAQLQMIVDQALKDHPSGAVVALDPEDGSVLAMYSKPSFNPNAWSGRLSQMEKTRADNDPFKPMLDKTVRAYFPGSVFKVAGSYAGLDRGAVEPDDEVDCHGAHHFGGTRFRCWKWGGHGSVDMREAIQHSCDVYFYKLAETIGIDTIHEYASKFGFGERTGFPLNQEQRGRVPTREWHRQNSPNGYQPGFALNTIIGQGDTLTSPLQVALAYGAIANGGQVYYPRLFEEVRAGDGRQLFEFPPKVRKRLEIDDADLEVVRDGLHRVVNEEGGTAYNIRLDEIAISGKTGTAQVHSIKQVRIPNRDKTFRLRDHAWFVGYAPSDDPELVVAVFLEHAGHGGRQAAPVASELFDRYLHRDKRPSLSRKIGRDLRHDTELSTDVE